MGMLLYKPLRLLFPYLMVFVSLPTAGHHLKSLNQKKQKVTPTVCSILEIEAGARPAAWTAYREGYLDWADATASRLSAGSGNQARFQYWVPYRSAEALRQRFRDRLSLPIDNENHPTQGIENLVLVRFGQAEINRSFPDRLKENGELVESEADTRWINGTLEYKLPSSRFQFVALTPPNASVIPDEVRARYATPKPSRLLAVIPGSSPNVRPKSSVTTAIFWGVNLVFAIGWIAHRRSRREWLGGVGARLV